jgi:uncharacterized protein involved in exopolysaccharide biosynthesis
MILRILLLTVLVATPLEAVMQAEALHSVMEDAALASQSYGAKHPRVIQLNKEIDRRLAAGDRIDAEAIEKRLTDLIESRLELRKRYGARHPKTIENAKRIQAIAGLIVSAE